MQKWKARGINTLVGVELEGGIVKPADYVAAAHAAGLYVVGTDPACDAFQQPDEPDTDTTTPAKQPPALQAAYAAFKRVAPAKPVFVSFSGGKMVWRAEADYAEYAKAADWLSFDQYLANGGSLSADPVGTQAAWDSYTGHVDTLVRLGKGKPVFVFIECSDQNLRIQGYLHDPANQPQGELWASQMRTPTPDEMERQVTVAKAHGAAGIIYFPQRIGVNFESFDATPPELEDRMKLINARLAGKAVPDIVTKPTTVPTTQPAFPLLIGVFKGVNGAEFTITRTK